MNEIDIYKIGEKIRKRLIPTKFRDHVINNAWEYTWMDGFRIKVSDFLGFKFGDIVLDVGCGDGWYSIQNALAYPYVKFVGVDLYEADEASEIAKLLGLRNCIFYRLDALKMSFKEKFDHVVTFMALGNICESPSDMECLLQNCWRALKSRGKLLIVEAFQEDFPNNVREKLNIIYDHYKRLGKSVGENKESILSREITLYILEKVGFIVLNFVKHEFDWFMTRNEVKEYFGLKDLPIELPDKFWVFDKPRQVSIIISEKR